MDIVIVPLNDVVILKSSTFVLSSFSGHSIASYIACMGVLTSLDYILTGIIAL